MKINLLASALVVTLLFGPTSLVQGQDQTSSESTTAAKARKDAVDKVLADLATAISNDPQNASKYSAAAVQILGIDTSTEAGRAELASIQATARDAVSLTDSFKAMTQAQKDSTLASINTDSAAAVGTAPSFATITSSVTPPNPLNFPNTLELNNPLITATIAGILGNNTEPAGTRATTFFAGLGFASGSSFTTSSPATDGTIPIVVNPPPVTNPSPPQTL
jgi:hypothetical protein